MTGRPAEGSDEVASMKQVGRQGATPRRALPLVALVVSLGVLVGVPATWALTRDAAPVPQIPLAAPPDVPSPADDDVSPQDLDGSSGAAVPGATIARPALFSVPSLGIATEVRPVGVRDDGQVAIPSDGDLVGWYRFGSAPGSGAGSAVIVGHRDTRAEGPGVFYRLGEVQVGDVITVFRDDWVQVRYRVTSKESITKTALPLDRLFERTGAPRLTVITCGGNYVQGRGYDENIVVTAVPTGT